MAKIDFTKIEGWNEMSAEDKLKALEDYEVPDPDYSGYVKKEVFDKTASDLSKAKKDLKSTLTAEEQARQEQKEKQDELERKYNELLRENTISKNTTKFLSLGYTEELALETATAVADGDFDKVFANSQKHLKSFEKQIRADALKDTPKPTDDGQGTAVMTLEKLRGMTPQDRYTYSVEHPQEYKELYGKTE